MNVTVEGTSLVAVFFRDSNERGGVSLTGCRAFWNQCALLSNELS